MLRNKRAILPPSTGVVGLRAMAQAMALRILNSNSDANHLGGICFQMPVRVWIVQLCDRIMSQCVA